MDNRKKKIEKIDEILDPLGKSIYNLTDLVKLKLDYPELKPFLKGLERILDNLYDKKKQLQEKCKHDFEYFCGGHNDDAYKCTICGEMEYR